MTRQLTIGSLFSGYGGLDMAAEHVFDARTAWVSDIDEGACKVLAHRFPDVPNLGDITTIDWANVEPVDIITGGFPCQDVSTAGRRAGLTSGTRSGLWSEMARAVETIRPRFVVIENVRGLTSATAASNVEPCAWCLGDDTAHAMRALGAVLGDLADLGLDAEWRGLRASDVGACHQRFRVFVLAWRRDAVPDDTGRIRGHEAVEHDGRGTQAGDWAGVPHQPDRHADGFGPDGGLTLLPTPVADNSRGLPQPGTDFQSLPNEVAHRWDQYAAAVARHERMIGRPAPSPVEPGRNGKPRLSAEFTSWMMGLPAGWITDTPDVTRNEALKLCGNGVVPQQAEAALWDMVAAMRQEVAA